MKRIQRKRTKGWKKPENAIYVGRGSKWGNPIMELGGILYVDASYRRKVFSKWVTFCDGTYGVESAVSIYKSLFDENNPFLGVPDLRYWSERLRALDLSELEGKDLLCWCPPNKACHADVLIELVQKNKEVIPLIWKIQDDFFDTIKHYLKMGYKFYEELPDSPYTILLVGQKQKKPH